MNEEELAALAEQLYAKGLSDKDVALHLDRAIMGQQPEQETSPAQAMATHALEAITDYAGSKPSSSGASRGGGRPHIDTQDFFQRQAYGDILNSGEEEHPNASLVGVGTGLALPFIASGLSKAGELAAEGTEKGLGTAGRVLKTLGKNAAKQTRIGRTVAGTVRDLKSSAPAAAKGAAQTIEGLETSIVPSAAEDIPSPVPRPTPEQSAQISEMEIPTYQRRAAQSRAKPTRTVSGPTTIQRPTMRSEVAKIIEENRVARAAKDELVNPEKPELGKYTKGSPTQKAAGGVRVQSPQMAPQNVADALRQLKQDPTSQRALDYLATNAPDVLEQAKKVLGI